jgi:hypothetical protein
MHQSVMRHMYEDCATWALGVREARSYQPRFIFLSIHPHQCDGHCIALHPTNAPPSSRPRPPELIKGHGRAQMALSSLFKPPNDIISARGCASAAALHHGSDARDRGARRGRRSESLDSTSARREMSKMTSHRWISGVVLRWAHKAAVLRCKYMGILRSDEGCGGCKIAMGGSGLSGKRDEVCIRCVLGLRYVV